MHDTAAADAAADAAATGTVAAANTTTSVRVLAAVVLSE